MGEETIREKMVAMLGTPEGDSNLEHKPKFEDNFPERLVDNDIGNNDERYYITNEVAKTKLDDDIGEILTYPAVHLFHGIMPEKILKDVTEYCTKTNNNLAAPKLVANLEGTQSNLDEHDPLMKEFVERMMLSACTFVENCQMNYGRGPAPKRIDIQEIWDVKMQPGDYNPMHIHGTHAKEGLSSIFYLKVPDSLREAYEEGATNPKYEYAEKRDGWLQFLWGLATQIGDHDDFACATNSHILPIVGHYYIFPKSLNHQVFPFTSDEDRWSVQINFNCWEEFEEESWQLRRDKEKERDKNSDATPTSKW